MSTKRKLPIPDAQQAFKSVKISATSSPHNSDEAGPELPPATNTDLDPQSPISEDEEGDRFFSSGIDTTTISALDYIDTHSPPPTVINPVWLKRAIATLSKKLSLNTSLRAQYPTEPQKFIDSEADLDAEIKTFSILSEHPELWDEFASGKGPEVLVGSLAHENADIAISVAEVLGEVLDPEEGGSGARGRVIASLMGCGLVDLILMNLQRLDEKEEVDRGGVFHLLGVVEGVVSASAGEGGDADAAASQLGERADLINWLTTRMGKDEAILSQNKQYAAEVLQIILQTSPAARRIFTNIPDGVDLLLRQVSVFRDATLPKGSLEVEFAENLFDSLTCLVGEDEGKKLFLDAEGVELCLLFLKEKKSSLRGAVLRLLNYALLSNSTITPTSDGAEAAERTSRGDGSSSGGRGGSNGTILPPDPRPPVTLLLSTRLITFSGLKILFPLLRKPLPLSQLTHLLSLLATLLSTLPGTSEERIRLLAKFDTAKITSLLSLKEKLSGPGEAEEYAVQLIDLILAWLVAEGQERGFILQRVDKEDIRESLGIRAEGLEEERDMIGTLIGFL
ncbi:DUF1716-domain-containing protein [Piedraia hortae CBS 480.64]|uniref:DUF1716-domain-containing protein n=1 Tax=Piedraia hortae CBS 480.64 TaxID=1314780 RepID=A0A6A7BRL8_9PEZI|nr:DUF1716-domain-containing protein [Piedraia hortae CBS 480.64]